MNYGDSEDVPCLDGTTSPTYAISTRTSSGPTGLILEVDGRIFATRVDARVLSAMFQRKAAQELRMNLLGLSYPFVFSGDGYIGPLCPGDHVVFVPGNGSDVAAMDQPRTRAQPDPKRKKQKNISASKSENFLDRLEEKEKFEYIEAFSRQIRVDTTIHVVTDGGANPNPGAAGWVSLIRQNGKSPHNWGHYANASNNAMELRVVIEAFSRLPPGLHVWGSTDSAYVKRGITEWLSGWSMRN
jgi:hypothetical protein